MAITAIGFVVLLGLLIPKLAIPGGNDPPVIEGGVAKFTFVRPYRRTPLAPVLDAMSSALGVTRFHGKVVFRRLGLGGVLRACVSYLRYCLGRQTHCGLHRGNTGMRLGTGDRAHALLRRADRRSARWPESDQKAHKSRFNGEARRF